MRSKNISCLLFAAAICMLFSACKKDNPGKPEIEIPAEATVSLETSVYKAMYLDTKLELGTSATYKWSIEETPSGLYSITRTDSLKAYFLTMEAGTYKMKLNASENGKSYIRNIVLTVKQEDKTFSPYISKVYDFMPAVGQFTNKLPQYEEGNTKEDIVKKVEKTLSGKKNPGLISLGGFGGYVTFGFDHTVVNVKGKRDIRIMANAFYAAANPNPNAPKGGSCEPGIIMVAYDANKNGVPDKDEWYEIAGSEYKKETTIKNYEITYYRPESENGPADKYIRWEDNQGNSGYKSKNNFHKQCYYPNWIKEDKITFRGTLLPNNAIDESGNGTYWVLYAYGFGYADNAPNGDADSAFDISWAVNSKGDKVELPGVDFVKVYTGINQEAGWLGEVSTEVGGAYDLHMEKEEIQSEPAIP